MEELVEKLIDAINLRRGFQVDNRRPEVLFHLEAVWALLLKQHLDRNGKDLLLTVEMKVSLVKTNDCLSETCAKRAVVPRPVRQKGKEPFEVYTLDREIFKHTEQQYERFSPFGRFHNFKKTYWYNTPHIYTNVPFINELIIRFIPEKLTDDVCQKCYTQMSVHADMIPTLFTQTLNLLNASTNPESLQDVQA